MEYLLTKDIKGKFRYVILDSFWDENKSCYIISRVTAQYKGKETQQPYIEIYKGKAKRTVTEQKNLEYQSYKKKFKDKGYVEVPKHPNEYSESELKEIFGDVVTNQAGVIKPMLAKQEQNIKNRKIFDKVWLASRKINGIRCLMYWDGEKVQTSSRGGTNYNYSTRHLIENPLLIQIFKQYPTLILDLELYKFGKSLQQCSGAARMEKNAYDCDWLEMYVYDCYFTNKPELKACERIQFLQNLSNQYNFTFNPEREWNDKELQLQMVPHEKVSGWENMQKLHNEYVSEGWEGLVIRDPDQPYKPNARSNSMIKIKHYLDATYKIIGYELGLRGTEDMVFICEMEDGRTFKAMPIGNRKIKQEYVDNFEEKYKNHLGDCKYFELSDDGKPCQPKFLTWRFDLE